MGINEEILAIVKERGPVLPAQISGNVNESVLMTSARLSELLSNKQIKISYLKVGGSPLYYFSGQENKLQEHSDNLEDKEKEAYTLLKDKKILRDREQEPAIRVALRQIKDFAIPLQVEYQGNTEIFWKWYLTPPEETQQSIKDTLSGKLIAEDKLEKEKIEIPKEAAEKKKEKPQKKLEEKRAETKKSENKEPKIQKGYFILEVMSFFNQNNISILEEKDVKKNSETNYVLEVDTPIGKTKYFCKARKKKKISDADLSTAFVQAQARNLPLLFLTDGELTKKAKEALENELQNINFKNI
ncbi:hypothetical protein ISS07_01835 [Candidatus Woesearchaeota archaeon]|nr:hypothetical protein [Candidatus Woesearchaeota archaeon]